MNKLIHNPLTIKFALVLGLLILLQIPVSMISELIDERSLRQEEVIKDIARSSSEQQRIIGPFITVNYTKNVYQNGRMVKNEYCYFILPTLLDASAKLESFAKYRGIYHARLYQAQTGLSGSFDLSEIEKLHPFDISHVRLVVGIQDSRGLIKFDAMTMAGNDIDLEPGTGITAIPQGFHSNIDLSQLDTSEPLQFDLNFVLQGMGQLQVTPVGNQTQIELSSAWPHPSFIGNHLPISSNITDSGFTAQWSSNQFSNNIMQVFQSCLLHNNSCQELQKTEMGVALIEPVDHYLKSYRAINYSLLVITLVFASFLLLELFQARPVHPVQYSLVGLALALFYLLLISMSEHLGFNWAYAVSAAASTSLLSLYVGGMLDNNKHGALFGFSLLVLYAILFGLLLSENYALLMGSILCFTILSLVMLLTRKVNWYNQSHQIHTDQHNNPAKQTSENVDE